MQSLPRAISALAPTLVRNGGRIIRSLHLCRVCFEAGRRCWAGAIRVQDAALLLLGRPSAAASARSPVDGVGETGAWSSPSMPELYRLKCGAVIEHVYGSYPERGEGIYAAGA